MGVLVCFCTAKIRTNGREMKHSYLKKNEKSWPSNLKLLSDRYVSTYYSIPSRYMQRNSVGVWPVWRRKKLHMKESVGKLYS